ncbi:MAG: UDP-N-acetylmuramoyl-L-alanine--D-glutamate ligase [Saprospiraceae bacterium]|nr:UDP-N-acetylmuramoyl-L-alanine--D-glutamate ligase [Saprospiraceae bacterium]MBK8451459.1 UDP-N-acetylmuramoyl-L-alanine--D-glutamate ligase [Saprospiraceae bacterium]MBK8483414.1 UDP-N-acetylmuramoyl-L-alanine--D-glutamate ligase [Saprospiraceae bacterium]MBK9220925.1 UDP-N-acetylmuramoyl-L-alanine--D-glutamate ligase [Saprospiraceae bacterium]MBK9729251.1 UDP-N-acetylmuramoyl-L-alanine--D-glutamate ligase [Saprospiraceae bacterium]
MILILGAGESGVGAALLAKKMTLPVFVSDSNAIRDSFRKELIDNEIDFEEGSHDIAYGISPNFIVKSPGIPDQAEIIGHFKNQGIDVISEIEFAYRYCRGTIIGITGSNGKTTTTNLIFHLLKQNNKDVIKAGNVGFSFARAISIKNWEYYVLELSSFQLDGIQEFKPRFGVLLNITPDHMDRYQNQFDLYVASKFRITENQTSEDFLITYEKDPAIQKYLKEHGIQARLLSLNPDFNLNEEVILDGSIIANLKNTVLKGKHNAINVACAVKIATFIGLRQEEIQSALLNFVNDPHRLESVGEINEVLFVNDSKATNVDSVFWALDAMKQKVVWIAGGLDKGNDYAAIEALVVQKVSALICLGVDNQKLLKSFTKIVPLIKDTHSIQDAVRIAFEIAKKGEVVLLSPGCASFDLFKNYEDRGNQFKEEVKKLSLLTK